MKRKTLLLGCGSFFIIVWLFLLPSRLAVSLDDTFTHDARDYHLGAVHLVQDGMYSLDGTTPFLEREPGQSFFLAIVYAVFGVGNRLAIFAVQGLLYLFAAFVFTREFGRQTSVRIGDICFLLLLILPSVFHTIFSVYRESFALSLMLLFVTMFLRFQRAPSWHRAVGTGVLLGAVILTYIPFLFFPLAFLPLWLLLRFPVRHLGVLLLVPCVIVGLWGLRNQAHTGTFVLTAGERTTWMWYVRGEQAENIRGLEPFHCLWSEYISRNWNGRSRYCSYNGVVHQRLIDGENFDDTLGISHAGQQKILMYLPHYLWFSVFEVLELHLPYVNGWGKLYNQLAALGMAVLYAGCFLALQRLKQIVLALPVALILYSTVIFSLTDATPRYLLPIIFCYAAIAAIGYNALLRKFHF